jgi:hypothetical protein
VVRRGRVDLTPLLTQSFPLERIAEGYRVFGERLEDALKGGDPAVDLGGGEPRS